MFTPRQLTETDIRFKKLLDASPMPKSVRRLYENLGQQKQHERHKLQEQQRPGSKLNPGIGHGSLKADEKDEPTAKAPPNPNGESSSSSAGNKPPQAIDAVDVQNNTEQKDAPSTQSRESKYKKSIQGASSSRAESGRTGISVRAASHRRRSGRSSGPRDYWVLGSRRKLPIYNETMLSKPRM
ncbi:hypothetical protein TWF281_004644 [Arthrobotrys megalospora]